MRSINRIGLVGSVVALAAVGVLSACTAKPATEKPVGGSFSNSSSAAAVPSTSPTHEPAVVTITPAPESTQVNPVEGVKIAVANGTLKDVVMTSPEGVTVKGSLSQDRTSWATTEDLGYDKTYAVKATALNPQGEEKVASTTLSTIKPANLTMPYIQTAAGGAVDGMTFGVGQVIRVHFDEKITDRATAQKAISVKITPAQVGGFNWLGDQDVYWRTKDYMKAGSKVSISVKAYGVDFGGGLYGQADPTPVSFKVGHKQVSIVSDKDLQMRVYRDDKLMRTIPVSMGRHVTIKGDNGQDIDLRTNSGPHVVVGGEKQIKMSSGTFGVDPKTNPNGYSVTIPVGVRISYDGEYVHWADWSIWAQGNTDQSHGCLNVSPDNAYWFYDFSQPGDIVDVRDTGRKLQLWNSGYWTVSWADWLKGNPAQ